MRVRLHEALAPIRSVVKARRLPVAAKRERDADSLGLPEHEDDIEQTIYRAVRWLGRAQDCSASADGGVARHYSLINGWGPSYPETTGYIIPTLLAYAERFGDESACGRAQRMLDWLVSIQFSSGGFQGGEIGAKPRLPVTFNTGQILIGLASGVQSFGKYEEAMCRAADWLVATQDEDGCWRKHPTPFASPGEKSYETHVAWGLLEAARVEPNRGYAEAAVRNVRWALTLQRDNGWFESCCLSDPSKPLTHTIGYVLRGVIEAHRYTQEPSFLEAAKRTANGLLTAVGANGFLPGRIGPDWNGRASWCCLTGSAQISYCWLYLYRVTGNRDYRDAAFQVNRYVRMTVKPDGSPDTRGGVKGSFPVDGPYGKYQYLNWACKFFIDANIFELDVRALDRASGADRSEA